MTTTTQTFDVQLGTFTASYRLYETNAPVDYDGFGTITVADGGTLRFVLVRTEHEEWQTMRYRSGMFSAVLTDLDDSEARYVTETLYKRLVAPPLTSR
jgi:hypothetical protein